MASITGHTLAKASGELVTVTLEYEAGADRTDGDFTVAFGDIILNYSYVDYEIVAKLIIENNDTKTKYMKKNIY